MEDMGIFIAPYQKALWVISDIVGYIGGLMEYEEKLKLKSFILRIDSRTSGKKGYTGRLQENNFSEAFEFKRKCTLNGSTIQYYK